MGSLGHVSTQGHEPPLEQLWNTRQDSLCNHRSYQAIPHSSPSPIASSQFNITTGNIHHGTKDATHSSQCSSSGEGDKLSLQVWQMLTTDDHGSLILSIERSRLQHLMVPYSLIELSHLHVRNVYDRQIVSLSFFGCRRCFCWKQLERTGFW